MLPSLDQTRARELAVLGKALGFLPYPFGEDCINWDQPDECTVHLAVAILQMCGVKLGYNLSFANCSEDPISPQLALDNDELRDKPWVVAYVQDPLPAEWIPGLLKARKVLESAVPVEVRLQCCDWLHAVVAFRHFYATSDNNRHLAGSRLGRYSQRFAPYETSIYHALQGWDLVL